MSAAEVSRLVRDEVNRLFGGHEHIRFHENSGVKSDGRGAFFDRFVDVMQSINTNLKELSDRVGKLEDRMSNMEQMMLWREHDGHE
jgi:hypothetical protein